MAVRASSVPTLVDITRTLNPDGTQARIAEILEKDNPLLEDMTWKEGNLVTGERTTVRTSLPTVAFRRLNEGVPRSKSTSRQVDEAAALLEANSQVDRKLAILSGNPAAYRLSEARAFMEAMNQKMATTLFYGNATLSMKEFTGLAPRFNSKSGPTAGQIIDAAGTGTDNRSIWLVGWDVDKVTGIYPKGTVGGLQHMDTTANKTVAADGYAIGDEVLDGDGNPYLGYKDHWEWNCGLAVKDPRYVVRVANIDVSDLTYNGATGALLQDLMVQAVERLQGSSGTFYLPRRLTTFLRRQLLANKNPYLSLDEIAGRRVLSFDGFAVKRTDALEVDEARVV